MAKTMLDYCRTKGTTAGVINDATVNTTYKIPLTLAIAGNQTSTVTARVIGAVPVAGTIVDVVCSHGENGADSLDALSATFDVLKNGTTVLATLGALAKAAGDGKKTTYIGATGTGITAPILSATAGHYAVAVGDVLTLTWTLTRTTPDTEIANVCVTVVVSQTTTNVVGS